MLIIYASDFRQQTQKTTNQWASILYLAEKWGFENITFLAIDNLIVHATPIDKIVLGRRHGIVEWLPAAYEAVCTRVDPLTVEEGIKLGVEDTVRISAARQLYGTGRACHEAKYLSGDLGQIFKLVEPAEDYFEFEDRAEADLKLLQEQFSEAKNRRAAHLDLLVDCAGVHGRKHHWQGRSSYCHFCSRSFESENGKFLKEVMEMKERQVILLKDKIRDERKNRMAFFK